MILCGEKRGITRVRSSKTSSVFPDILLAGLRESRMCVCHWLKKWLSARGVSRTDYLFSVGGVNPISYSIVMLFY